MEDFILLLGGLVLLLAALSAGAAVSDRLTRRPARPSRNFNRDFR